MSQPAPGILAEKIITLATDFVGFVERKSNAEFDDPKTVPWEKDKSDWLVAWMRRVPGWTPGAPYCAAFDGAIAAAALEMLGIHPALFLQRWTAHVMTNVRMLQKRRLLTQLALPGSLWLARHGSTDRGHAGVGINCIQGQLTTIEGNTSAGPTADEEKQRQGDGIWLRTFAKSGRGQLLTQGFLPPPNLLFLATAKP